MSWLSELRSHCSQVSVPGKHSWQQLKLEVGVGEQAWKAMQLDPTPWWTELLKQSHSAVCAGWLCKHSACTWARDKGGKLSAPFDPQVALYHTVYHLCGTQQSSDSTVIMRKCLKYLCILSGFPMFVSYCFGNILLRIACDKLFLCTDKWAYLSYLPAN